jgi:hypothetical protein
MVSASFPTMAATADAALFSSAETVYDKPLDEPLILDGIAADDKAAVLGSLLTTATGTFNAFMKPGRENPELTVLLLGLLLTLP